MDTLQNMRAFSYVAETGSFTAAAVQPDTATANVSLAVSNLEAHLQTRLLNRTTRRIALTEAGKRYLLRCEQILTYVEEAEAEASDAYARAGRRQAGRRAGGQLKVHTMTGIGQHFVIDAIAHYHVLCVRQHEAFLNDAWSLIAITLSPSTGEQSVSTSGPGCVKTPAIV
jgi:DNA-binding transcriptional LysR family regulator